MPELETYTPDDLERVRDLLKSPEGEQELEKWVKDWVNVHLAATEAFQFIGFENFTFRMAETLGNFSTTSASFVDATDGGPRIDGFANGDWLVWFGAHVAEISASGTANAQVGLATNFGTSDTHVAHTELRLNGANGCAYGRHYNGVDAPSFNQSPNNSVRHQYRRQSGAGTPEFRKRWILMIRTGEGSA